MKSVPDKMELELLRIRNKNQKSSIEKLEEYAEKLKERRDYHKEREATWERACMEENFRAKILFTFVAKIMNGFFQNRTLNTANIKGLIKRFLEENTTYQFNEACELKSINAVPFGMEVDKAQGMKEDLFDSLSAKLGVSLKEEEKEKEPDTSQKNISDGYSRCGFNKEGVNFKEAYRKMAEDIVKKIKQTKVKDEQ